MALVKVDFFSQSLRRLVTFNALVPSDAPDEWKVGSEHHYRRETKTLYLLHGFTGSCNDWLHNGTVRTLSVKYNLAIIMPSGENSFYVDAAGTGRAYGQYIGQELVAYTGKLFGLSGKREDTFIAGLSMGGFGALRNALKYNRTFGKAAALSSALIVNGIKNMKPGTDNVVADYDYYASAFGALTRLDDSESNPEYLVTRLLQNKEVFPELYIACGKDDFLIQENREFKAYLDKNGVSAHYIEDDGIHDWAYWNKHIEPAIQWMLGEE